MSSARLSSQRVSGDRERGAENRVPGSGEFLGCAAPGPYYDYAQGAEFETNARGGVEWGMTQFRSFDPATGTYMGFDGIRHPCP